MKVPYAIASILIVGFNGFLLLRVAWLVGLLRKAWSRAGEGEAALNVMQSHTGVMNPFAGLLQKVAVGALVGFCVLSVFTGSDAAAVGGNGSRLSQSSLAWRLSPACWRPSAAS